MDKSKFEDNNLALFDIQSKLSAYGPVNSDLKSQPGTRIYRDFFRPIPRYHVIEKSRFRDNSAVIYCDSAAIPW